MPTIVAMCPYCRAGGVRAPQSAVGASATCPKCKSSFTVMPSEGLPGWAKEASDAPPKCQSAPPATTEETKPAAAMGMADVTEPSPLLQTNNKSPAVAAPSSEEQGEPADLGLVFGLVALILVGVAVVASQFPYGRVVAAGIAIVGLLGGIAALGAEGRGRVAGACAIAMHAFILLVVLFFPSWLSLNPWRAPVDAADLPQVPMALEHRGGQSRALQPTEWIDAATASWQFQDARVTIRSAYIGPVDLVGPNDAKRKSKEPYFHLRLRVANAGVARDIPLSGWAAGQVADAVRVTDSSGKPFKLAAFETGWIPDRGKPSDRLFPSKASEVHLIFALPPGKVDSLRVQLPGAALGFRDQDIRFQISTSFLARNAAS